MVLGDSKARLSGRKFARLLVTVVVMTGVAIGFNNCAPAAKSAQDKLTLSTPQLKTKNKLVTNTRTIRLPASQELNANLKLSTSNKTATDSLSLDLCQKSTTYKCSLNAFGRDVVASSADVDFDCVTLSDGTGICPSGHVVGNNTAVAQKLCAASNCSENYEYSEYNCKWSSRLAGGNSANSSDLNSALESAYNSCKSMASKVSVE